MEEGDGQNGSDWMGKKGKPLSYFVDEHFFSSIIA